jgi:CBS domain-containing protein
MVLQTLEGCFKIFMLFPSPYALLQSLVRVLDSRSGLPSPHRTIREGGSIMHIRSVLSGTSRSIITIGADATVSEAVDVLVRENIGSLPVIDDTGAMVGIFTERDILRGLHNQGKEFCQEPISSVMTRQVVSCSVAESVHDAMGRMSEHRIGQLPVLDDGGGLVGLVSVGDLIRFLHESAEEERKNLMNYVYGPA